MRDWFAGLKAQRAKAAPEPVTPADFPGVTDLEPVEPQQIRQFSEPVTPVTPVIPENTVWPACTAAVGETHSPAGHDVTAWRAWMRRRMLVWIARGLSLAETRRSVWAEAEYEWHCRHGAPPDPDRCAGCGGWLLEGPGMPIGDGAVVHLDEIHGLDCQVLYGEQWRGAASAGLVALGLKRPQS
jgi:hypothetical protein